jgi:RHS repeat-associated protein
MAKKLKLNQAIILFLIFSLSFELILPSIIYAAETADVKTESAATAKTVAVSTDENAPTPAVSATPQAAASASPTPSQTDQDANSTKSGIKIEADKMSGALNYNYPISIPAGRNSFGPVLSLAYNSQTKNNDNIFGYGWSISIPSIERQNKIGSDKLYTENYFTSSLTGELKSINLTDDIHGLYGSKVDNGEFLKYEFQNDNSWLVTDKKGTKYKFGLTANSRQDDPADSNRIYKWQIEEMRDLNNNWIKFEYTKDAGQIYPQKIYYTGNGATSGIFEIEFISEARTDKNISYSSGFKTETNYRIKEIAAKINGQWSKKYSLAYSSGTNTNRSVLQSITESGQDNLSNIIALPPTKFNYAPSSKQWVKDASLILPASFGTSSSHDAGSRMIDVNGDGLADVLTAYYPSPNKVYLNTGNGFKEDPNWSIPVKFTNGNGNDNGVMFADVNGDGLIDLLRQDSTYDLGTNGVYTNTGSGWTKNPNWSLPIYLTQGYINYGARLVDLNNDGRSDILFSNENWQTKTAYINSGTGWQRDDSWFIPIYFMNASTDFGARLSDVNNDGLIDILSAKSTSPNKVYLNTGHGFSEDPNWTIPLKFTNGNANDTGVIFADVNGDGFTDLLRKDASSDLQYNGVYINTGSGWTLDPAWVIPVNYLTQNGINYGAAIEDINGDGLFDVLYSNSYQGRNEVYLHQGIVPDLMAEVDDRLGAKTKINYQSSANYFDASGNILNPNLPFNLQTVKKIETNDGFNSLSTLNYGYTGGEYYSLSYLDRQFTGFHTIVETDSDGNKTISYYHQGNTSDTAKGELSDYISKVNKVYRQELYDALDKLYQVKINRWENISLPGFRNFVKQTRITEMSYDGNADHRDQAQEMVYDDANGNVTSQIDYGEVLANNDGSFADTGTDKISTNIEYALNSNKNILTLSKRQTSYGQGGNVLGQSEYYYDTLNWGLVEKGNLTLEKKLINPNSDFTYSRTEYNSFGLPISTTNPRGFKTSVSYDAYNLYPIQIINAKNQITASAYNYFTGEPVEVIDPNNFKIQKIYDALNRPVKELMTDPSNAAQLIEIKKYEYDDVNFPTSVIEKAYPNQNDNNGQLIEITKKTYLDGLGRTIQTKAKGENGLYIANNLIYNQRGLLAKEFLPEFSLMIDFESIDQNDPNNTYAYDALGRVTKISNSLGNTNFSYDQWQKTITDPNAKQKIFYFDAKNNLVKVMELLTGVAKNTIYTYNQLNLLTKITDARGNIRKFNYNLLGDQTRAEDLHNPADLTFGVGTKSYDKNNNLTQTIDPRGIKVRYTYDVLDRLISENIVNADNTLTRQLTYVYDAGVNGIGRLTKASNSTYEKNYTYDIAGRKLKEVFKTDSQTFTTTYSYDSLNNLVSIKYPDNSQIKYVFNNAGQIEKIINPVTGSDILKSVDYEVNGQINRIEMGNGAITTNIYDRNQMYRLINKSTGANSVKIQDLTYTYDAVGNITHISDKSAGNLAKEADYTYDDLYRLTKATITSAANGKNYTQTYSYDALGNILNKSDVGKYVYDGSNSLTWAATYANPQAVTKITSLLSDVTGAGTQVFGYDNAGNLTSDGIFNYSWNYKNELLSSNKTGKAVNYTYDENGQRIFKSVTAGSTIKTYYPNQYTEKENGIFRDRIYLGDTNIATIKNGTIYYNHADQLGSSSIETNAAGQIVESLDYYPFGSVRLDEKTSGYEDNHKYTGKELDEETNLYYYGARYYNGKIGRFVSEDPAYLAVGDKNKIKQITGQELQQYLSDPQGLNNYSYVKNNPLIAIDPNGEWVEYIIGEKNTVALGNWANNLYDNNSVARYAMDHPYQTGAVMGVVGGALVAGGIVAAGGSITCGILCGSAAATVATIGGTAATTEGDKIQKATNGLNIGQSFGKLGNVIENQSGKIMGFNRNGNFHGLDQAITRGVSPQMILETTKNPLVTLEQSGGNILYLTRQAAVVLNQAGKVVTTYGKDLFQPHIFDILNKIK